MNWGISNQLKTAFTDLVPVQKYIVKDQVIQDPNWLALYQERDVFSWRFINLK